MALFQGAAETTGPACKPKTKRNKIKCPQLQHISSHQKDAIVKQFNILPSIRWLWDGTMGCAPCARGLAWTAAAVFCTGVEILLRETKKSAKSPGRLNAVLIYIQLNAFSCFKNNLLCAQGAIFYTYITFFLNKNRRFSLCVFSPPRFYAPPARRRQPLFNGEEPVDGTTFGELRQEQTGQGVPGVVRERFQVAHDQCKLRLSKNRVVLGGPGQSEARDSNNRRDTRSAISAKLQPAAAQDHAAQDNCSSITGRF